MLEGFFSNDGTFLIDNADLVVLSHVILYPLGQKQSLYTVEAGLVSVLVHVVFHLGISFNNG